MSVQAAIADAFETLADSDGVSVVIRRGASETVVTAVVGTSVVEVPDEQGFPTVVRVRDYHVLAADYAFDGTASLPARGDQIDQTLDGGTCTFEVLPPAGGRPVFEWQDPGRAWLIVHTKQVT